MNNRERIMRLRQEKKLDRNEMIQLLETANREDREYLAAQAREVREKIYGKDVFVRGLIEFTNICRNDCYYCGIRKSNEKVERYRLTPEEILSCAKEGYELGFRTFVLQGGEDGWFTKERVASIVREFKKQFPSESVRKRNMNVFVRRGQTVTFCATRRRMTLTIENCIRRK